MLSLYYAIGGYVSDNSRGGTWGTGAIDEISARLREELPGLRGFSSGNIKLMRQFFEAWQPYLQTNADSFLESKSVATAIELDHSDVDLAISEKRLPAVISFPMEAFIEISFTHHMEIIHKTKELDERLFYICECATGHWSKTVLRAKLKDLGQLNFYLSALDEKERKNGENPSIGILLCREANKSVVELAIRDYSKPMGVATYHTADELPVNYKVLAPIIEEVPKLLDEGIRG